MVRKGLIFTAAAWAALAGMAAQAQSVPKPKPCLTTEEAEAAMLMMAPGALRGLRSACEPKLPGTAYLRISGDRLSARIVAAQKETEAAGNLAVAKIMGIKPGKTSFNAAALFDPMAEAMVASSEEKLDAKTCGKIDRILFLLDPLPARNLSGLIALVASMAEKKDGNRTFSICESQG